MTQAFHIVTPEYPPQVGGVGDFCRILADGLVERGCRVDVWCPPATGQPETAGATVHPSLGGFGPAALAETDRILDSFPKPRRLLIQWSPFGYGWKGMNLPFCWWVYRRMRRGDTVDLMVHEAFVEFAGKLRHRTIAAVQRLMVFILLRASTRVWCAIPRWEELLRPFAREETDFKRMPVCSCVPQLKIEPSSVYEYAFGHFSSFGVSTSEPLRSLLPPLLDRSPGASMLLIGRGGESFRDQFLREYPEQAPRLFATGTLPLEEVVRQMNRCAVMLQAVNGGISSRNTSLLASLANGLPVVTTTGPLTEHFWAESSCVALVPNGNVDAFVEEAIRIGASADDRIALRKARMELYDRLFHPRHLIEELFH